MDSNKFRSLRTTLDEFTIRQNVSERFVQLRIMYEFSGLFELLIKLCETMDWTIFVILMRDLFIACASVGSYTTYYFALYPV